MKQITLIYKGVVYDVPMQEKVSFGRSSKNDVVFPNRKELEGADRMFFVGVVSRNHFTIHQDETGIFVEDNKSTHGTFVKGKAENEWEKVSGKFPLKDGDKLRLGEAENHNCVLEVKIQ